MARTGQHLRRHPGWKILPTKIGNCSDTDCVHRFRCEDNNVDITHMQPHYYGVRQVEPCHQLGWSSQALFLSISTLGAMPKNNSSATRAILQNSAPRGSHSGDARKRGANLTTKPISRFRLLLYNYYIKLLLRQKRSSGICFHEYHRIPIEEKLTLIELSGLGKHDFRSTSGRRHLD